MNSIEGLPIAVLALDRVQRVVDLDPRAPEVLTTSREALLGRPIDDLFSPRDRRGALDFATKLSRLSDGVADVTIVLRLGGEDRLSRIRIARRGEGYLAYVEPSLGADDFTHRLVLAQQRWEALIRRSDEGIVRVNANGEIVEHNGRFFEIMDFADAHGVRLSEDALVGRPLVTMVGEETFPDLDAYLAAPSGDYTSATEKDGHALELRASPLVLPASGAAEVFIIVRDVSDERRVRQRDEVIARDLQDARAFQRAILSSVPPPPSDYDIDVFYEPLEQVGGDLYDVSFLDDSTLRLFVADATGHGVAAGLATMLIKSSFELVKRSERSPSQAMRALNDHVAGSYAALEVVFTAVIADVDTESGTVRYSIGAHPPPLLATAGSVAVLPGSGAFLGAARDIDFEQWEASLDPGSGLYVFSDGFADARNVEGEFFGESRFHAAIRAAHPLGEGVTAAIHGRVAAFTRPRRPDDDMTLIAVRRR
jgi:PAS domain-containing protein